MASIPIVQKPAPVTITKFLGLNSGENSETQLQLGEANEMYNIRVTEGYKLEQVDGYINVLPDTVVNKHIVLIEPVKVNSIDMLIVYTEQKEFYAIETTNGSSYTANRIDGTKTYKEPSCFLNLMIKFISSQLKIY